jgi:hypothetical protein
MTHQWGHPAGQHANIFETSYPDLRGRARNLYWNGVGATRHTQPSGTGAGRRESFARGELP